jgi:hypothetical protein
MADLRAQVSKAKAAGYSDAEITAFLGKDPSFGPKVQQARAAGYKDAEIIGHLSAPAKHTFLGDIGETMANAGRNVAEKYRAMGDEAGAGGRRVADRAKQVGFLRAATENAFAPVRNKGPGAGDLAAAALSPISGVMHATLRPVAEAATNAFGPTYKTASPVEQVTSVVSGRGFIAPQRQSHDESVARLEGDIGTALSAGMPATKAGLAVSAAQAAPRVNSLARTVAEFDQAGVRPSLASAGGKGPSIIANTVGENALAGVRVRKALRGTISDVAASAGRTADRFGAPASRGATGEAVQEGVRGFNERFSARSSRNYDKAFTPIEAAETRAAATAGGKPIIKADETRQAIHSIWGRVNSPELRSMITDPRVKGIGDALEASPEALRFGDLRALRTWVREAKGNPQLRQGIPSASLSRLEGALTKDIAVNAEALAGPQAARRLQQADRFHRIGSQRIEGQLQAFVGKAAPKTGESTYDVIVRAASDKAGADLARLSALKKSLQPQEWGDVAATTIQRLGGAEEADFSIHKFVSGLENLSPGGKEVLFGSGPLRAELENLQRVAARVKAVEKGANMSNSGVNVQNAVTLSQAFNPAAWKVLGTMALSGEAMTNPAVVRWIANIGSARSPAALSSAIGRLNAAAKANRHLVPLAEAVSIAAQKSGKHVRAETAKQPVAPTALPGGQ